MNAISYPEYVPSAIFTHYTGLGRDKLYNLIKAGKIRAKRTDSGRMIIEMASVREYIASLPDAVERKAPQPTMDLFALGAP
jgi:excisionase family DNA binding protein